MILLQVISLSDRLNLLFAHEVQSLSPFWPDIWFFPISIIIWGSRSNKAHFHSRLKQVVLIFFVWFRADNASFSSYSVPTIFVPCVILGFLWKWTCTVHGYRNYCLRESHQRISLVSWIIRYINILLWQSWTTKCRSEPVHLQFHHSVVLSLLLDTVLPWQNVKKSLLLHTNVM